MPFDINIQIIPATEQNSGKFYSFGQTRSLGVRGIQKLLNLFAKYLLTPVGSDPLDLTYGTQLPNLLGSNVTPADAQDVLTIAVDKAATWLQGIQRSADIPMLILGPATQEEWLSNIAARGGVPSRAMILKEPYYYRVSVD